MTDILAYFIMFLCGIALATVYFTATNKGDKANKRPDQINAQEILSLQARVKLLENKMEAKAKSAIQNVEITDAIKRIMQEHQDMRELISEFASNFNTTVTRLIATFRPWAEVERKKKEISQ